MYMYVESIVRQWLIYYDDDDDGMMAMVVVVLVVVVVVVMMVRSLHLVRIWLDASTAKRARSCFGFVGTAQTELSLWLCWHCTNRAITSMH